MRNNLNIMCREIVLWVFLLFVVQQISATNEHEHASCPPSSCGKISNISYPFRLKGDSKRCGDHRYELACENNFTVLYLYSGKYHVQAINYNNFTIRVVDPGLQEQNFSSFPRYFLSQSNFTDTYDIMLKKMDPYQAGQSPLFNPTSNGKLLFSPIIFLNCTHPITNNPGYVDTEPFIKWYSSGYIYAYSGDMPTGEIQVGCHVKFVALHSLRYIGVPKQSIYPSSIPSDYSNIGRNKISYADMHRELVYGFEISWLRLACEDRCGPLRLPYPGQYCYFNSSSQTAECLEHYCHSFLGYYSITCGRWYQLRQYVKDTIYGVLIGLLELIKGRNQEFEGETDYKAGLAIGHYGLPSFWAGKFLLGLTLFIGLMLYKWKRRHLSTYENIENYLEQNNLMPIRYSYKEIKKMVKGFKDKLGEGGYGSVFKGKLCSGPCVAIKMLRKAKGNGQDFINEVATIGRIHHQNIVQLIGFCVEGSKRALVYEFMPNGSLDKFVFSDVGGIPLTYDQIYNISIGVAHGIAYLHHGCEMQILHFDIKPYNILLDENFTPRVSDFGLAKLYPIDNNIVTMTGARGTIGYMAPELFYKNIGGISHKVDVYSFGMLLLEMASKRKNLNPHVEHSSQIYFPLWIYDQLEKDIDVEMEDVTENEKQIAKKMIIVALWCIQLIPNDRPTMNQVIEMLEGDIESLQIPPKPLLYPHETLTENQTINSNQTMLSYFSSSSYSTEIATNTLTDNSI